MLFLTMIFAVFLLFFRYFFHNIVSAEIIFLYFFYFLLFNLSTNTFLLYIINFFYNIVFSPFFSILIAYIFRFFPIFILFPSKTYVFYYDNAGPPYRALFRYLKCAQRFDYRTLDSSRKLGGVAEHLIDGSEKRICRLSFEC